MFPSLVLNMKRGAEKQLTKDGHDDDDDDIEEIQDPQGFQKADEAALTKRHIRALPKRALATSRPPALNGLPPVPPSDVDKVETPPTPRFGGFGGFGAGPSASNPFTFTTQQPPPTSQSTSTLNSILAPSLFGAPKQFPSDSDASPPKSVGSSPPAEETDATAFKYFKSLRGLNVSFLSVISAAVEKDPFCDVASLVDSYKNLRTTIQSEFDGTSRSSAPVTTNSPAFFGTKAPSEKPTSLFSMPKPKPASGFNEASNKPPSTTDSGSKTAGFTFPPFIPPSTSMPAQLPFGLAPKPSESPAPLSTPPAEPPKSAFKFPASSMPATTSSMENTSANSASGSPSQEIEGPSTSSSSQPISTTPTFGSNSTPSFFSTNKTTNALATSDASSKPMSVFGSSVFGSSSTIESNKPSPFNPSPPDSKDNSKAGTPFFGSATTAPSAAPTSIFGSSDKPVSFFGSATQPKTGAFTFGKPAGSIGNPVGFGFGSPSSGTGDGSSSSGFGFGGLSTKPSESLFSPPMTDKSSESTPQPEAEGSEEGGEEEAAVKLLPSRAHDEEGEGEEDEETIHVVRCKLFRLTKKEDNSEWKDLGIGMLRLKKHKETNVRRVLMRNSSTGRILINFRIYAGLKAVLAKATVSFIGYENNTPASFRIRVKTEEQATELKQAMERETEAVQTDH